MFSYWTSNKSTIDGWSILGGGRSLCASADFAVLSMPAESHHLVPGDRKNLLRQVFVLCNLSFMTRSV